ncbi:MAG: hypothetical protein ACRD2P_00475 [Terriglobia bacterium]
MQKPSTLRVRLRPNSLGSSGNDGKFYKIDLAKMFAIASASRYCGYFSM